MLCDAHICWGKSETHGCPIFSYKFKKSSGFSSTVATMMLIHTKKKQKLPLFTYKMPTNGDISVVTKPQQNTG